MAPSRTVVAAVLGGVIGGVAGYLFFTEQGRTFRRDLEPAIDDFARELQSFRRMIEKAATVASEGLKLLNDAMAEHGSSESYPLHQTTPF